MSAVWLASTSGKALELGFWGVDFRSEQPNLNGVDRTLWLPMRRDPGRGLKDLQTSDRLRFAGSAMYQPQVQVPERCGIRR
jgi:hypothetical protein